MGTTEPTLAWRPSFSRERVTDEWTRYARQLYVVMDCMGAHHEAVERLSLNWVLDFSVEVPRAWSNLEDRLATLETVVESVAAVEHWTRAGLAIAYERLRVVTREGFEVAKRHPGYADLLGPPLARLEQRLAAYDRSRVVCLTS